MSSHISLTCARCQRTLKVRSAYLGQWISCNHCGHAFLAAEVQTKPEAASSPECATSSNEDDVEQQAAWVRSLEAQLETAWDESSRLQTTVDVLKAELLERVSEVDRLGRSAEDLITVRAERDLGEVERRALSAMAEQLRTRLDEVERLHAASKAQEESARREQEQQLEAALRDWETKRRQLLAHGEEELRSTREGIAQLSAEVAALQSELATVRADRDAALEHSAWLRQERDRFADCEGEWERTLEESACEHRAEIDALATELRKARQQLNLAMGHETELNERLGIVQAELESVRQELDAERQSHMEQTTALVQELQDLFQDQLSHERQRSAQAQQTCQCEIDTLARQHADAREQAQALEGERGRLAADLATIQAEFQAQAGVPQEQPPVAADPLRQEITALQEAVDLLKQQRDAANEHAGALRLERDQLRDCHARLEARLQEVEESHRLADHLPTRAPARPPAHGVTVIECAAEVVWDSPAVEPPISMPVMAWSLPEPKYAPGVAIEVDAAPKPLGSLEHVELPPAVCVVAEMLRQALHESPEEIPVPCEPETPAQPSEDDSVEHRIRSLREHLREDNDGPKAKAGRRLFRRLARILRSGESR